ncbi:MAG: TolB-like 6-bladed beta-propeller domain-containing protein [Prevotellaceae bacterium]|jgi:hypothetical protein|nr:TolB-like 6-bladed beta-propeller domain-containing protein [Prevotellaceae bacterium]
MRCCIILALLTAFLSCREGEYSYFYGETVIVDTNVQPDTLYGKKIELDSIYTGNMWAYDTLIGFSSHKFPDYWMYVFNVNTGKFLYPLCERGHGPGEFPDITDTDQRIYEEQLYYWIRKESGKDECVLVNLEKQGDFIKRKMDIKIKTEFTRPFSSVFILNDSMFLANNQGEAQFQEEGPFTPPAYHLYNSRTKERIKTYRMYNGFIPVSPDYFFGRAGASTSYSSRDRIKPDDMSKLAMGMHHIDQINILDLKTGKIKGFRNKTSPDFSYLKDIDNHRQYYSHIFVDDRYIYGLYADPKYRTGKRGRNTVNIFDWDGNFIRKLFLDKTILDIALDPVNKHLYVDTTGEDEEEIYSYDVSHLYK